MAYTIKWRPKALAELRKLPNIAAKRIVQKMDSAKNDPHHFLDKLVGDPGYKIRAGDYRAIVDIIEEEKAIAVRIVGHRKNIYQRNL
ncbi:type II toxin-antitoxin system RelE/ParE family toxin [Candidatus Woesearchaeota archaeon]|nr:type II toxin-antitoxin system RelE/ParE family toxin [Candidatus Woesearchaeota archaeon]